MAKKSDKLCVVDGCRREKARRDLFCWPCYRMLIDKAKPHGLDDIVEAYEEHGIPIRVPRKYPRLSKEQVDWARKHVVQKSRTLRQLALDLKVSENTLNRAFYRYGFRERCPA